MTSKECKLSCKYGLEVLDAFFNNVDQDTRY